ncbi:MAG: aminotransferase class I/II-fold pyridoxal phosphate-dependent enzyme [Methanoculleaceae archaeon]
MGDLVSDRARQIPPSGIRRFFDIAAGMEGVISLGVGEPDFVTPWEICEASIHSIEMGVTGYTSNRGMPELRDALAEDLRRRYGLSYNPEREIIITSGVSEALDIAIRAVINPGDRVLIAEPCYVSYAPCVILAGGRPVWLSCREEDGFRLMPDMLAEAIGPETRAIIANYPNNPTGGVMGRDDWKAVADLISDHDLLLISDEVYSELTYDGHHTAAATVDGLRERTVTLNGFSKAYSMTGWRLGYLCAPEEITAAALKIHQYVMLCAPVMSQVAARQALRHGEAAKESMVREFLLRRNLFVNGLNRIGLRCHTPGGAFYAFPDISHTGMTDGEFAEALLREERVAVVPGSAFGPSGRGHIRCSYAASRDNLREALVRMESFLGRLHSA